MKNARLNELAGATYELFRYAGKLNLYLSHVGSVQSLDSERVLRETADIEEAFLRLKELEVFLSKPPDEDEKNAE